MDVTTTALFEGSNTKVTLQDAPADASVDVAGIIGFNASEVRGTLGLAMNPEVAIATRLQATQQDSDETQMFDWVGELANQLLGRFKTRWPNMAWTYASGPPWCFAA